MNKTKESTLLRIWFFLLIITANIALYIGHINENTDILDLGIIILVLSIFAEFFTLLVKSIEKLKHTIEKKEDN